MECPICFESLSDKPISFIFSECLHKYHLHCYKDWLNYSGKNKLLCPECNTVNNDYVILKPFKKESVLHKVKQKNGGNDSNIKNNTYQERNYLKKNNTYNLKIIKKYDTCSCIIS